MSASSLSSSFIAVIFFRSLRTKAKHLIKVRPPQGIVFASSGTESLLDREGVRAILDTPLKFNPSVAEAELSYVLLYELVHLNVALRASCAVSCPVVLRACCTASKALVPVRGTRRDPSPFAHAARHPRP